MPEECNNVEVNCYSQGDQSECRDICFGPHAATSAKNCHGGLVSKGCGPCDPCGWGIVPQHMMCGSGVGSGPGICRQKPVATPGEVACFVHGVLGLPFLPDDVKIICAGGCNKGPCCNKIGAAGNCGSVIGPIVHRLDSFPKKGGACGVADGYRKNGDGCSCPCVVSGEGGITYTTGGGSNLHVNVKVTCAGSVLYTGPLTLRQLRAWQVSYQAQREGNKMHEAYLKDACCQVDDECECP